MPTQNAIKAEHNGTTFPCGSVECPEKGIQSIRWNVEATVLYNHAGTFEERCEAAKEEAEKIVGEFYEFLKTINEIKI